MKSLVVVFCVLLALLLQPRTASAQDHFVYKVTAIIPDLAVVTSTTAAPDVTVKKTLKENDLVNLALGRAIGTKVDPKTEVLAAVVQFESPSNSPQAKLVVFDPTQNGSLGVTVTVATLTSLDYDTAYLNNRSQGFGIAGAVIQPTSTGDTAHWALLSSTMSGSASAAGSHAELVGAKTVISGFATISGRFNFRYTDPHTGTHDFSGIVVAGSLHLSGKRIGAY